MISLRSLTTGALAAALLIVAPGCGSKDTPVKVEGKVTLDGQPVGDALVTFIPTEGGQQANGRTGSDGFFRLSTRGTNDGAVPGKYKVTIQKEKVATKPPIEKTGDTPADMEAMMRKYMTDKNNKKGNKPPSKEGPKKSEGALPEMYGDPGKTNLKAEVPGDGKFEYDLRSAGG